MGPQASCAQTGGLLWPPPGRPHSRWLGACSLTAALQGTHTASGRKGASPRRRAASASASRVLCRSEDARWGPFPGRPGAVSTARAAARCSEASTPEDGPARPSVLQLRTLLRLLMSQPRGTSCDKKRPCRQARRGLPSPVGGRGAPLPLRLPASHFIPESSPVSTSHVFRASSGTFVPSQVFHDDRGSSSLLCSRGAHRRGVCLGTHFSRDPGRAPPPAGQLSTARTCGEWEEGTKSVSIRPANAGRPLSAWHGASKRVICCCIFPQLSLKKILYEFL